MMYALRAVLVFVLCVQVHTKEPKGKDAAAAQAEGSGGDIQKIAMDLADKANKAYADGDMDAAATHFSKLDEYIGVVHSMGIMNLAVVYTQQNKLVLALQTYRKATKRYPEDASVFLSFCRFGANLVNMKIYDMMASDELIAVCNHAVKFDPANAEALIVLGSAYTLQMKFSDAWPILEKAINKAKKNKNFGQHQQALTNLVLANLRGARPAEALRWSKELVSVKYHGGRPNRFYMVMYCAGGFEPN